MALGYSFPYVIALLSKSVEIQMILRQKSHIQTIPISSCRCIATVGKGSSNLLVFSSRYPFVIYILALDSHSFYSCFDSKVLKQKSVPLYIANKAQIWRLEPIPLSKQVHCSLYSPSSVHSFD